MDKINIDVSQLSLHYQKQHLFDNLHFHVQAGQWVGLLGASGVGKSSLLRIIAGLEFTKDSFVSCKMNQDLKEQVVLMAQQDLLMPWLSVLENCLLGYRLRGQQVDQALRTRACDLLAKVGLQNVLHKRPQQLSGGMRQRVALVRTFMEDKPVVLMDEPFSALDAVTRIQLQNVAVELLKDKTVLFVTHDPLEALRLGDAVYVMQGRPATLSEAVMPEGRAPRDVTDTNLMAQQAKLLQLLAEDVPV